MRNFYARIRQPRFSKVVLLTLTLSLLVVGVLLAAVVNKRFQVQTSVEVILCQEDGKGGWKIIDRARDTSRFESTLIELASKREYASDFKWHGRSEKGCQAIAGQSRPVAEKWDKTTGVYELTVPTEFTINGKTFNATYKATTERIDTPIGSFSGERATWANNTLSAGLVSTFKFRANPNLFNCDRRGNSQRAETSGKNAEQEFLVVLKNKGSYRLIN
ncbi:MAG TPA: hypothetical protein VFZ34_29185 [Blastocatellia bacterium]|nr:hypothetical protein [Blastocatellia bacterium]